MQNNTNKNQQLLKDRLFLEKVFLLDIESCSQTNATDLTTTLESQSKLFGNSNVRSGDRDTVPEPVSRRTISPVNFVSIYAIVVTLLLLLPSNREGANGKTVVEDAERENERISLLETKIQQVEAKTQILASEVNVDPQHESLPVVETAKPVSLPVHSAATELEAISLDRERNVDNTAQLPTDTDRLPPLPETASSPVVIQTSIQSAIVDTVDTAIIPTDRLPPLPVPEPPSFVSQTPLLLPLPPTSVRTVTAINTADINSPVEPEVEPKLEIKSEIIVPETTVEEKIEKPAEQWLGQTDVVYYSFSFQEDSTSENLTEPEASLPDDEDLKQYLTTVPRSTKQLVASDRSLDSDSQPIAEPTQLLVDQRSDSSFLRSDRYDLSSTVSDSEELGQPKLFDDEDLARYLDSAPLLDDEYIRQILGTSPSTELKTQSETDKKEAVTFEVADKNSELNAQNIVRQSSTDSNLVELKTERPLFADENLRQFLTHTALFDDSTLKQKLK